MKLLELTLPTAAENLALDEALLLAAEEAGGPREVLRLWEPAAPLVVVGRASRVEEEVHVDACRELDIPIFRRTSGGAAIITGPGCLMYAVVLAYEHRPRLRMIDQAHRLVLETLAAGLNRREKAAAAPIVQHSGTSDLTLGGRMKFSGNSLRCCRTHLLYHGTLLYAFPLELAERCLRMPPRQPEYRAGRPHARFIANLRVGRDELRRAVIAAWQTRTDFPLRWPVETDGEVHPAGDGGGGAPLDERVRELTRALVLEKYSKDDWNRRR